MPTFAAVDIGANSVRLKIARLDRGRLLSVGEDREVTRLGESVFARGSLSTEAMEHTVRVLRRFRRSAVAAGAEYTRVVATSALRDASNAHAFIDWVRSAIGWNIEVITGLEEGRLIHLALMSGMPKARGARSLLFDLGGGSCEITLSDRGDIRYMVSLPLGAVRLTREFLKHDPPKRKELERATAFIREELRRVHDALTRQRLEIAIATSGTADALSSVWRRRQHGHPTTVPTTAVAALRDELARLAAAARAKYDGIGTRRAEIIVAGALVYAELLTTVGLRSFRYSPLGLRDGLLAQMSADYDRGTAFQRRIDSERRNAVASMARHYGVDLRFGQHVHALAIQLFDGLQRMHRLPSDYRDWLAAAAMLHEAGTYVNRAGRNRHTYYLISNSELFGFTAEQRNIVAAIARYIGKSKPAADSRPIRVLSPVDQANVQKAIVLLRLARALDQSRRGMVKDILVHMARARVVLELETKRGSIELERWALDKDRRYFRDVFGRELVLAD
jgi:exopolyphosphatase / guanosine-5'-triphosphate,3'-diphosphate pyrophosphatase